MNHEALLDLARKQGKEIPPQGKSPIDYGIWIIMLGFLVVFVVGLVDVVRWFWRIISTGQ